MRAHVIENGKVVNTIEISSLDAVPGLDLIDASLGGNIGDGWDGKKFFDPTTQAERDAAHNSTLKQKIAEIESKQHRAVREAALGDATHLAAIEAQIDALRAQLK